MPMIMLPWSSTCLTTHWWSQHGPPRAAGCSVSQPRNLTCRWTQPSPSLICAMSRTAPTLIYGHYRQVCLFASLAMNIYPCAMCNVCFKIFLSVLDRPCFCIFFRFFLVHALFSSLPFRCQYQCNGLPGKIRVWMITGRMRRLTLLTN